MRVRLIKLIDFVLRFLIRYLYLIPKNIMKLPFQKELYRHESYYPEKKQKPVAMIFFEQCLQILKYSTPNGYYFMYGFDVKNRKQQSDYIHYTPFMERRDLLNLSFPHNSSCILRNKIYFGIFAKSLGISTVENVAYVEDGMFFLFGKQKKCSVEDFVNLGDCSLFCKSMDGECGEGIFSLKIQQGTIYYNQQIISIDVFKKCLSGRKILFQEYVRQHPVMARLYDKSINTIRLVTIKNLSENRIVTIPAILRIGANGSIVDNTSRGGIAVGLDLDTGRLDEYGFYKPEYGLKTEKHPNSDIPFATVVIPYVKEAVEQAMFLHSMLSDVHSIGWDIAIGEEGPIFIEGNDNWEINGHQDGKHGLKKEFEAYFFSKKK